MGIGDMIGLVSAAFGMVIAYPALLILLNIAFPRTTATVSTRLSKGLRLPFIVGLVLTVVVGFVIVTLVSAGSVAQLLGFILYLLLVFWAAIGIAGMSRVVGQRVSRLNERSHAPLIEMLSGGIILTFSFGFPIIGWFFILPLASVLGLGVAVMSLLRQRKPEQINIEQTAINVTTG